MLKHTTRWVRAVVRDLHYRLDVNTLHRDEAATTLTLNEVGRVALRVTQPLYYDPLPAQPGDRLVHPGRRGLERHGRRRHAAPSRRLSRAVAGATNITWHEGTVTRDERSALLGGRGRPCGSPACRGRASRRVADRGGARDWWPRAVPPTASTATTCGPGINADLGF